MDFADLIRAYFERSTALQWYWTVYILVIGGLLGFSILRLRPQLATTILVTVLYCGFAYKNLGAIEAIAMERAALLALIKDFPISGPDAESISRVRSTLDPVLPPYDIAAARYFHIFCDLLTVAVVWVKEWDRRKLRSELAGQSK